MNAMPMESIRHRRITWVNITRATPDDIEALREEYSHFHPLDLEDLLSRIERPKIDEYDDYLFSVMHFPVWDSIKKISRPSEVDVFVGIGYLVTVHDGTLKPLETIFRRCSNDDKARDLYMSHGAGQLFHTIIDQLVDYLFPILNKVDSKIQRVEEEIFDLDSADIIQELALLRRDNIALQRIVRPQLEILERLENIERPYIRDELEVYFSDLRDHLSKAADLISDHKQIIEGLADTANILANYRTNRIVQVLTVISVIMMPLTLISGIYGMNINLPFQEHPASFVMVFGIMIAIAVSMLAYFKVQHWL